MISTKSRLALAASLAFATLAAAGAAHAGTGCNGVVSPAEWGCAPWDNNNGPQFPHYKKPAGQPAPQQPAPPAATQALRPAPGTNGAGLVASGGGNLVASGGGNLVASGGGNLVASGGGNVKPNGK